MRPAALCCWVLALGSAASALAGEVPVDERLRQLQVRDPRLFHWLFPAARIQGADAEPPELAARARGRVLFCEALALKARGKHAEALARLEQALALDRESPTLLFEIGHCHYRMGKPDEAARFLQRSLALDPDNGPAHETMAFVHAAASRRAEALEAFEAAAKAARRPARHQSLVRHIIWVYEQQGDRTKAIEWYRFLLDCGYRSRDDYRKLATLELKEGRYAEALATFRQVALRTPSDVASAVAIARAFAELNDAERNAAIRHIEAAVAKADDPASREVLAMAYRAAGRRDDMLGQLGRVAASASRRAATLRRYLAEFYEQLGDLPKAIAWRQRILASGPNAADHIRLAGLYIKRQQMPEAAAEYRNAIARDPRRRDLLRRVADCHSALYRWERAAAVLQEYLDGEGKPLSPVRATVVYAVGELYDQAGKDALATTWKQRAFKLLADAIGRPRPGRTLDDAQLHLLMAELYYADDQPDKARDYLIVARRLDPDDPKKTLLAAAAAKHVQRWAEAATVYQEFLARDNTSLAAASAFLELAKCQEILDDRAAAVVSREKAKQIILRAGRTATAAAAKAAAHAQLGENALRQNKPRDAARHLLEGVRLDPREGMYHLLLAQAYEYLADWRRAAASYATYFQSRGREPRAADARTLFRFGVAQSRSGQPDRGRTHKARAIALLTDQLRTLDDEQRGTPAGKAELLRDLAGLYAADKQFPKAIDTVQRAIRLAPSARRTDYRLALAAIHDDARHYDDSEKVLLATLRDDPDEPSVLNHLGYHYAVRGIKLDEAVRLVQRALHYDPLNGAYVDSLGWAYHKQGKHTQALRQLLRAVQLDEDAVLRDHLGDAYRKLGQIDRAREAWTKALALDPQIEGVAQKLEDTKDEAPPKPKPDPEPKPEPPPKPDKPPEPEKPPPNDEW